MTYPETIKYLESFINYEKIPAWPYKKSLKLERIKDFLETIGNPQDNLSCIHIAGTKGKGSTCAFVTHILREAGYKVGLYTSPHLSDFKERIRILKPKGASLAPQEKEDFEGMILKNELTDLVNELKAPIDKYNKKSKYGPLSFFEIYTSLAFAYFKEKNVNFVVLETGLGGRLDATNVVNPLVVAVTPISYEHTQKLGVTLREIAAEKAGIIKKHQDTLPTGRQAKTQGHKLMVISAPQEKEAIEVIRKKCQDVGAKLYEVNKDIFYEAQSEGFNVIGLFGEYPCLKIRFLGKHQLINATVAVGVIEALRPYNTYIGIDSIRSGLYNTIWPGRCEIISKNPMIVLDGAQNIASSRALKKAIKDNFEYKRLILTLGISNDKDIKGICSELSGLADEVVLTKANNSRATEPKILAKFFKHKNVHMTLNVKEAQTLVCGMAKKEDLILVCGSLFVVGEFRDAQIQS
ncbi:MAG: bifunctional folylpolyglutamate synthase/dihydrofolate synthase [Candidatus Omnitrophica bacterium]|nr:bifunctional folylpolyglutamate synthase/dihydrofolate synthase [Candidatus Omnitrophota bacterium]